MYKIIIIGVLLFFTCFATPLYAGGGGGEEYETTEIVVRTEALQTVGILVRKGIIEQSWTDIKPEKAKKIPEQRGAAWVVVFKNPGAKEAEKRTLYVFTNANGDYVRANFSGN